MKKLTCLLRASAISSVLFGASLGNAAIATEYFSTTVGTRYDCSGAIGSSFCHDLPHTSATHICVATGFTGDRSAEDSNANVFLQSNPANGQWYFRSDPHENGRAWARCAPWSSFIKNSGDVVWSSDGVSARCKTSELGGICSGTANLWKGDAWSVLQGVSGEMEGGGEWARVGQTGTVGLSEVKVHTATGNFLMAASMVGLGQSFFIGVPNSTRLAPFISFQNGNWVKSNILFGTTTFDVSTTEGFSSYWLAPHSQGLCYMTRLSGDFNGSGESVRITVNGNNYFVTARAGNGKAYGSVRCMAYDTR
jgi:hypothetical protein